MIKRIGQWGRVRNLTFSINKEMLIAREVSLKRFGLQAEKVAKEHISSQDLSWDSLSPKTVAQKVKKGQSTHTLVATSSYFQAITSWVKKDSVFAGVKKSARTKGGDTMSDIASVHEFGSRSGKIPERPLWRPTLKEVIKWHFSHNTPEKILLRNLKKY